MNLLITGKKNVGKSTLVSKVLDVYTGRIGGYRTMREKTQLDVYYGIYIADVLEKKPALTVHNRIGECFPDTTCKSFCDVIETRGTALLTFDCMPDLILMDELGTMEEHCPLFKQAVIRHLDSDTDVLGVIKDKHSPFLDSIRNRQDVKIITVTKENREELTKRLIERFTPSLL